MYARAQRIALAFTAVALAWAVSTPAAQAQEQDCSQALTAMEEQYTVGRFDAVIDTLTQCLEEDSYDADQRRQAYRLLSLSYLGKELVEDARGSVRKLLEAVPNYQPDPVQDPPLFVEMVQEEKQQMAITDEDEPADDVPAEDQPAEDQPAEDQPAVDAVADEAEQEPPPELVRRPDDDRDEPPPPPIQRRPQEEGGSNLTRWLLIGGGVVAAGVVAAVLAGGGGGGGGNGGGGTPLPGPPALPGGN